MKPRLLLCMTVYNGRSFVPQAIESAMRLDQSAAEIDVLVLDDCSPEPGWSSELEQFCARTATNYYRSPRNLGIPRNVNLGLRCAVSERYDYVLVANSDLILPRRLINNLMSSLDQPNVGSVTAWSNNVSVYSLPNANADRYLSEQPVVDWISESLAGHFGDAAMDIPAGISFCILIPVPVVEEVGLMDPVFGRGYCEETDWTLRSLALGYRIALCPGTFVYHAGSASTHASGILTPGTTTVVENEAIIDLRYPQFRSQVRAFLGGRILMRAHHDAITAIIADAGRQFGYTVDVGWLPRPARDEFSVSCFVAPEGRPTVDLSFRGFSLSMEPDSRDPLGMITRLFGKGPEAINYIDPTARDAHLSFDMESKVVNRLHAYPTRV